MIVIAQPPGASRVPRLPARPLAERTYSLEWPHALSRAWWACSTAHNAYGELLCIADEQGAAASRELLDLVRVAHDHYAAVEAHFQPIYAAWAP